MFPFTVRSSSCGHRVVGLCLSSRVFVRYGRRTTHCPAGRTLAAAAIGFFLFLLRWGARIKFKLFFTARGADDGETGRK